jgi:hypothetical protein
MKCVICNKRIVKYHYPLEMCKKCGKAFRRRKMKNEY